MRVTGQGRSDTRIRHVHRTWSLRVTGEGMTRSQPTEQELFWAGEFGTAYTERNVPTPTGRMPFFGDILRLAPGVRSVCELGANRGHNLIALQSLDPSLRVTGVELNPSAFSMLFSLSGVTAVQSSVQNYEPGERFDLVFTCGVLIHINPD